MDSKSKQRALRIVRSQCELQVLQALRKEMVPRYMRLKERRSAYVLQRFFRRIRSGLGKRSKRHRHAHMADTSALQPPSASNSLFVSTLPSTVNGDLSRDSHELLLDVTSATNENQPPLTEVPVRTERANRSMNRHKAAASAAFKQAVQAVDLVGIKNRVVSRVSRRPDISFPATSLPGRASSAPPVGTSTAGHSLEYHRLLATLEKLRHKSDALYYQHRRAANLKGGPLTLHARRAKVQQRLSKLIHRLEQPARPAEVLCRATQAGEAAEAARKVRQAFDHFDSDGEGAGQPTEIIPGESIPPWSTLDEPYRHALSALKWPQGLPHEGRVHAVNAHEAAVDALGPGRHWWQVYHPDTGAQMDIRALQGSVAWPESVGPGVAGQPMSQGSMQPKAGQAGYKALMQKKYLPSHYADPSPVLTRGANASDPLAVATEGVLDLGHGLATLGRRAHSAPPVAEARGAAHHVYFGQTSTYGDVDPNARPDMGKRVSDGEASDLWLSYVCSPLPLFSQVAIDRALGLNEDQQGALPSKLMASLGLCVAPGQAMGALKGVLGVSHGSGSSAPTDASSPPSYSLDLTLTAAARALGVIDPWSTAAAYLDPHSVSDAVRQASLAAARADALAPNTMSEAQEAGAGAHGKSKQPSVDELLNMTADLAAAPPFDFYQGIRPLAEEEQRVGDIRRAASKASRTTSSAVRQVGSRGAEEVLVSDAGQLAGLGLAAPMGLPSLALPAESIARRVQVAYEALKRRLETAEALGLASSQAPLVPMPEADESSLLRATSSRVQAQRMPIGSTNIAMLHREVAARRIQHGWRGTKAIQQARAEAERRREEIAGMSSMKQAAVQAAMLQLVRVLETATGVDMGPAYMSRLGLTGGAQTRQTAASRQFSTAVPSRHGTGSTSLRPPTAGERPTSHALASWAGTPTRASAAAQRPYTASGSVHSPRSAYTPSGMSDMGMEDLRSAIAVGMPPPLPSATTPSLSDHRLGAGQGVRSAAASFYLRYGTETPHDQKAQGVSVPSRRYSDRSLGSTSGGVAGAGTGGSVHTPLSSQQADFARSMGRAPAGLTSLPSVQVQSGPGSAGGVPSRYSSHAHSGHGFGAAGSGSASSAALTDSLVSVSTLIPMHA